MLSVITLVRNRNRMLANFVKGWSAQSGVDLELIVVRAGGQEDPRDATHHHADIPVHHVSLAPALDDESIAYSHARNTGARAATGDLLMFCDADTIPGEDLGRSMHHALSDCDALMTADVRYLPPTADVAGFAASELVAVARPHPARPLPPPAGKVDLSFPHTLVWGLCMALRTSSFHEVGGFDESFSGYAVEDTDLAMKVRSSGRPAGLIGGACVIHQHHDSFEPPLHQMRSTLTNAQRYRKKWGVWPIEGWLEQFEALGLIEWNEAALRIIREPTPDEIENHRQRSAAPFRNDPDAVRSA